MIDIDSRKPFPAGDLSNFAAHTFVFDGIACASMEGFLQSLKFQDIPEQTRVCGLVGWNAKKAGFSAPDWRIKRILYWKGRAIFRESLDYQILLDEAYDALSQNQDFQKALLATGDEPLVHSIGKTDFKETILTTDELCSRLIYLRNKLK